MSYITSKDNGWIEGFLPLQALEIGCIEIQEPKLVSSPHLSTTVYSTERPIACLSYKTNIFKMPCLSILTPFCKVRSWDSLTGKLDLEVEEDSLTSIKLAALQQQIFSLLEENPQWFSLSGAKLKQDLMNNVQQLFQENILTVYLHGINPEKKQMGRAWIWKKNAWQKGVLSSTFQKGQEVRLALRFQGISFLHNRDTYKIKYRIQHQVVAAYLKTTQ
jgi:hypothetical protein